MVKNNNISIHSGFPNPATDSSLASINLQNLIIKHPSSTYLMRIEGNEWEEQGVFSGDIIILDRALDHKSSDTIVWWNDDNFRIGKVTQMPKNLEYFGVVTNIIHNLR